MCVPERKHTKNSRNPNPGDRENTIKRPAANKMTRPMPQSMYPCIGGRRNINITNSGRHNTNPAALPRADTRTASSPWPARHNRWAGRTDRTVSGSGTPRNVDGTASRNVCVIIVATIAAASPSGPNKTRRGPEAPARNPATVLECTPGIIPEIVPRRTPARHPATRPSIPEYRRDRILTLAVQYSFMLLAITRLAEKESPVLPKKVRQMRPSANNMDTNAVSSHHFVLKSAAVRFRHLSLRHPTTNLMQYFSQALSPHKKLRRSSTPVSPKPHG